MDIVLLGKGLLVTLGVLAALGLTVGLFWRLAYRGTWGQLVARYPHPGFTPRERWWFRSGHVGRAQMQLSMLVGADERGLSLAWGLPFLHSPRVLVPWDEVEIVEQMPSTMMTFPALPGVRVDLMGYWLRTFRQARDRSS